MDIQSSQAEMRPLYQGFGIQVSLLSSSTVCVTHLWCKVVDNNGVIADSWSPRLTVVCSFPNLGLIGPMYFTAYN
jgi:hypothetical protein